MSAMSRRSCWKWLILVFGLLPAIVLVNGLAAEDVPPEPVFPWHGCPAELHCLNLCQLDQLYCQATVRCKPYGWFSGRVILFTNNMPFPQFTKRLADRHWRGKHIECDGYFINEWQRMTALDSCIRIGPSYVDCKPTLIFEYPRLTPLFGPMRDEYREIAPGVWLGRMYRRRGQVFLGYNYLVLDRCGCKPNYLGPDNAPAEGDPTLGPPRPADAGTSRQEAQPRE